MNEPDSAGTLRFDGFRFDRRGGGCLFRLDHVGIAEPVRLGGRALTLLTLLLERRGELLSKDEIMKMVWPGRVVEEANLNMQIAHLRQILDEGREHGSCIQTVHGYGYRFVGPVRLESAPLIPAAAGDEVPPHSQRIIVVLSIAALGADGSRQYLANRINEDLVIDLSQIVDRLMAAVLSNKPVEMPISRAERADYAGHQLADVWAPSRDNCKNLGRSSNARLASSADPTT
jgi:DNA-binding winged helix-turn-helix (wHTH) protein